MAIELNEKALDHASRLIQQGLVVLDDRDRWSEDQPSARQEDQYIAEHGMSEYARWYLGIDPDQAEQNKSRYSFPYGDFHKVHRCGVLAAESRAAQYKHADVAGAAAHLHGMLETARARSR